MKSKGAGWPVGKAGAIKYKRRMFLLVIPEGAGPVNPLFLFLIFLLAVLRLPVGASG